MHRSASDLMSASIDRFDSIADVAEFITEFEACRLPKARWTHRAHLVAGLWYATRLDPEAACDAARRHISSHNESVGTPNTDESGYHETITRCYLRGIAMHVALHPTQDFMGLLNSLLRSPLVDSGWPLRFYSRERLFSVKARREWVEPDLAPVTV